MAQVVRDLKGQQGQQDEKKARERQSLEKYMVDLTDQIGNVIGKGLILENPSHLEATEDHKETLGGLLKGFIDSETGKPCTFISKTTGEVIEGGLPIRLFDEDAAAIAEHLGDRPARAQLHLLVQDATASIYRTQDGAVAYAALRISQVLGAAYRAPKLISF